MINTVIIDRQKEVREKITSILSAHGDFNVLACGKDAYDALKITGILKPDIAILDNHLEYIKGEEIPPLLKARSPSTAVVMLTAKASDWQLHRALVNDVSGLLHKETDMESLPWILKCISGGGRFISPFLTARILHPLTAANGILHATPEKIPPREDPAGFLSKTELQILTCVGEGNTSGEIAKTLNLATGTVRNYISSVMQKTGLRSRSQMVRYAFRYGLVPFGKP